MSDVLQVAGKLHKIFATQMVSSTFSKREFVIETDEQYPQMVKLELTQDKCELLSKFSEGDNVTVNFNVRGREWLNPKTNEMNYFVTLQAWQLQKSGNSTPTDSNSKPKTEKKSKEVPPKTPLDDSMSDDLPF